MGGSARPAKRGEVGLAGPARPMLGARLTSAGTAMNRSGVSSERA